MSENTKLSDLLSALSSGMSDEDLLYAGIAADIAFHAAIAEATHNNILM